MRLWGHYPPPPPPPPPPAAGAGTGAPCQAVVCKSVIGLTPLQSEKPGVSSSQCSTTALLTYNDTNPGWPCPAGYFMGGQT